MIADILRAQCGIMGSWGGQIAPLDKEIICWPALGNSPVMAGMSLIHWLNQNPVFIEEVTFQVQDDMVGRPIELTSVEASLTGEVVAFKLILPLQLDFAECVGLTCAIPFKAVGLATGRCQSASGEETTFKREGQVYGVVDVRFPEVGWSPEDYLRMYPHIERILNVESVEFSASPA